MIGGVRSQQQRVIMARKLQAGQCELCEAPPGKHYHWCSIGRAEWEKIVAARPKKEVRPTLPMRVVQAREQRALTDIMQFGRKPHDAQKLEVADTQDDEDSSVARSTRSFEIDRLPSHRPWTFYAAAFAAVCMLTIAVAAVLYHPSKSSERSASPSHTQIERSPTVSSQEVELSAAAEAELSAAAAQEKARLLAPYREYGRALLKSECQQRSASPQEFVDCFDRLQRDPARVRRILASGGPMVLKAYGYSP